MSFTVTPRDGTPAFPVDLTEFAAGRTGSKHNTWNGDLRGRPELIDDLYPSLSTSYLHQSKHTWVSRRTALRSLWRAFDDLPAGFHVTRLSDITDAHGELLRRCSGTYYPAWAEVIQRAVEENGLPVLNWPALPATELAIIDAVDEKLARRIYRVLKSEIRAIKAKWRLGDVLTVSGEIPSYVEVDAGEVSRLREFCQRYLNPLPDKASVNSKLRRDLPIPSYSAPGERGPKDIGRDAAFPDRLRTGPRSAALRWRYPTAVELALFFLAVLVGTGWNVSTVANLDISREDSWCQPHPLVADVVILKSLKGRTATIQEAICLRRPEFHPYQLLLTVIERTAPLREELRRRLNKIDEQISSSTCFSSELQVERERIVHAIRSPWIYFTGNELGQVGCFYTFQPIKAVGVALRAVLAKYGICNANGSPLAVRPSDFRDAWIGFAYANSGHSWLVAKLAAGHRSIDALRNYLRQRRWRAYSEEAVFRFQDALWTEIRARRIVDGTVLRLMVQDGAITEERRRRLAELRERTVVGVGCGSPTGTPPHELAPGHPVGVDCIIQRCVICRYALIFEDSFPGLCRRMAELRYLRTEVFSLTAWVESSFSEEEDVLAFVLSELFDEDRAAVEIERWTTAIRNGEHVVFGDEPHFGEGSTYG